MFRAIFSSSFLIFLQSCSPGFIADELRTQEANRLSINEKNRFAFLGDGKDIVAIINVGADSPNAGMSLTGGFTFLYSTARVCIIGELNLSSIEKGIIEDNYRKLKISPERIVNDLCVNAGELVKSDLILSRRSYLSNGVIKEFRRILKEIDDENFREAFVIKSSNITAELERLDAERDSLKYAISRSVTSGFGFLVLDNKSRTLCDTANSLNDIISPFRDEMISPRHFRKIDPTVLSIIAVDIDTAFSAAIKNQCRAIFGNEAGLKALIEAFERVKSPAYLDGPWVTKDLLDKYRQSFSRR
jgi:hypothetical protein